MMSPLRTLLGRWHRSLKHLGSGYLNSQRNATAVMIMTSTERSITSIEPSPSSGEKPKCRSIKSIGAALLRSTQSSNAPQTAMIEPKPISTPRAVRVHLITNKQPAIITGRRFVRRSRIAGIAPIVSERDACGSVHLPLLLTGRNRGSDCAPSAIACENVRRRKSRD